MIEHSHYSTHLFYAEPATIPTSKHKKKLIKKALKKMLEKRMNMLNLVSIKNESEYSDKDEWHNDWQNKVLKALKNDLNKLIALQASCGSGKGHLCLKLSEFYNMIIPSFDKGTHYANIDKIEKDDNFKLWGKFKNINPTWKICVYQNITSDKLLLLVYISNQNGNTILVDLIDNEIKEILSNIPKYDEVLYIFDEAHSCRNQLGFLGDKGRYWYNEVRIKKRISTNKDIHCLLNKLIKNGNKCLLMSATMDQQIIDELVFYRPDICKTIITVRKPKEFATEADIIYRDFDNDFIIEKILEYLKLDKQLMIVHSNTKIMKKFHDDLYKKHPELESESSIYSWNSNSKTDFIYIKAKSAKILSVVNKCHKAYDNHKIDCIIVNRKLSDKSTTTRDLNNCEMISNSKAQLAGRCTRTKKATIFMKSKLYKETTYIEEIDKIPNRIEEKLEFSTTLVNYLYGFYCQYKNKISEFDFDTKYSFHTAIAIVMGFLNHYFPSKPKEPKEPTKKPPKYTFKKFIYENKNYFLVKGYTIEDFWIDYNMLSTLDISNYIRLDFRIKIFNFIRFIENNYWRKHITPKINEGLKEKELKSKKKSGNTTRITKGKKETTLSEKQSIKLKLRTHNKCTLCQDNVIRDCAHITERKQYKHLEKLGTSCDSYDSDPNNYLGLCGSCHDLLDKGIVKFDTDKKKVVMIENGGKYNNKSISYNINDRNIRMLRGDIENFNAAGYWYKFGLDNCIKYFNNRNCFYS